MTKYKCGHEMNEVFLDDNILSLIAYFDWKESVGLEGDKSLCWDCYCKDSVKSQGTKE